MLIKVVNMIPRSLSAEMYRDSEPSISVNPANPLQIAASAFTPDPAGSGSAPIFVSVDGGNTWTLNVILPGGDVTNDITLSFATTSSVLYAAILRGDNFDLNILRTANFALPNPMTLLKIKTNDDQPCVRAASVRSADGKVTDQLFIGENDWNALPQSATVDVSLDAATAQPPAVFPVPLDPRQTSGQDGAIIVPAIHRSGTIYVAYFGWRVKKKSTYVSDVVVARDDNWAAGANHFTALVDPVDSMAGVRIVTKISLPHLNTLLLGTQRIGSSLAIAVAPNNRLVVYVVWADGTKAATYTLHLRRSHDGGVTWSGDLRAIAQATNPGLAINIKGQVAFLYQQLHNPGTGNRWQTHVEVSDDAFAHSADHILADVPDQLGPWYVGPNPIGDYAGLVSHGKDFYGAFSGYNTPDKANFPHGVTYQRNANFKTHVLTDLGGDVIEPSIDPFFFKLQECGDDHDDDERTPPSPHGGPHPTTGRPERAS